MTTVRSNTHSTTNAATRPQRSGPPPAPRDPQKQKVSKTWTQKRIENLMRAIKTGKQLVEKFDPLRAEGREAFRDRTAKIAEAARAHLEGLESILPHLNALHEANYEPEAARPKLAAGTTVWVKAGVWTRKYAGLYTADEVKDLKVVSINGKIIKARAEGGAMIVEPAGAFTTKEVDYNAASAAS